MRSSSLLARAPALSGAMLLVASLWLPGVHANGSDLRNGPLQERKLREAVHSWEAGESRQALAQLDALLRRQPDFQVAHLLRSQWLSARAGRPPPTSNGASADTLQQLLEEARLRVAPPKVADGALPASILRLPEKVPYLLAVDMRAARLYVLANNGDGLHVVSDHYASIGSAGYGKEVEGDLRTPTGVYRITRWLKGENLPDLYGSGAFPVDYPNDWDRARGRTGHGIWIHGVPSAAYSRVPRSSEGCVTLSNDELVALREFVDIGRTPVVLAETLEWLPREQVLAERDSFETALEEWRAAWSALDTATYLDFYADGFSDGERDLAAWREHKQRVNARKQWAEVQLEHLSVMDYPGEPGLRLVEFTQDYRSDNFEARSRKRMYWRLQPDGNWRIERETSS